MFYAGQSVAADSTDTFERDGGRKTDMETQAPVRDTAAAVSASLARRKYVSSSFRIGSAPVRAAPDDDTGHTQAADRYDLGLDLPPQPRRVPSATFHALQEWEGYVLNIGKEDFEARLIDLTAGATHEGEEATIPLLDVSDHDAKKLRVGAIFRWVIGYERTEGGSRRRVSQIVFRDLPAVTKSDLRDGEVWARDMFQSLNP
jgi:hypothetical protein